jgi:signal transduction histidine kinase
MLASVAGNSGSDYNGLGFSCPAEFDDTFERANFLKCRELSSVLQAKQLDRMDGVKERPVASDADELATLQRQVEMLKERLNQAQRLTALGELVGTTTHEFNNVLMTIINYAKLGLRHKDAATREKSFDKILTAANRAAKITGSILGMARNRSAGQDAIDLTQLVEDTLLLLEREMNKYRIMVEKQFRPIPQARVNGNQIQQVLLNLLINARQAMPGGGRLLIKLVYDEEAGMIDLVVRDYGCGIPAESLPRIFEPFYSTKSGPDASGKGGTGLGLSMCRDIIEAHHGRIRVDSTVGKGTAFTLKLPVAVQPAPIVTPVVTTTMVAPPIVMT